MIQWYSSLPLLPGHSSTKNSPMFYSNSNGDKNYVVELVIPKILIK
jgi:hypothetical protein